MRDHNYLSESIQGACEQDWLLTDDTKWLGKINTYLLLTEFEVRTVSYGPNFFLFDLWPKREHKIVGGKNEDK